MTMDAGGGAASSSGAVKKGFIIIILNIIILKNSKKGVKRCLNYQKPLLMNCPIQRSITTPPAWNNWLRALWWNNWFVVDITYFYV